MAYNLLFISSSRRAIPYPLPRGPSRKGLLHARFFVPLHSICWEMLGGWGAVDALVNYACSRRLLGISKRLSRSTGLAIREAIPCYSFLLLFLSRASGVRSRALVVH